jgi:hypothetical protein
VAGGRFCTIYSREMIETHREGFVGLKRFAGVFGCSFLIYFAFFGGHYVSGDNAQRIAWAKALLDCHCNDISAYLPGLHFSKYGIGLSLLHLPLIMSA